MTNEEALGAAVMRWMARCGTRAPVTIEVTTLFAYVRHGDRKFEVSWSKVGELSPQRLEAKLAVALTLP